jgi:hypothetical protein
MISHGQTKPKSINFSKEKPQTNKDSQNGLKSKKKKKLPYVLESFFSQAVFFC